MGVPPILFQFIRRVEELSASRQKRQECIDAALEEYQREDEEGREVLHEHILHLHESHASDLRLLIKYVKEVNRILESQPPQ